MKYAWLVCLSATSLLLVARNLSRMAAAQAGARENGRTRRSDQGALRRLIERGYAASSTTPAAQKAFDAAFPALRKRLTQRLHPAPLLGRVMELAHAARP
jgi:hypothetical protein